VCERKSQSGGESRTSCGVHTTIQIHIQYLGSTIAVVLVYYLSKSQRIRSLYLTKNLAIGLHQFQNRRQD
jgi:hypothetical protein